MIADLDSNLKHMLGVSRNGWNPTVALIILDRPSVWYFVEFIVKGVAMTCVFLWMLFVLRC